MVGIGKVSGQTLPLIQVPTIAGTGSEVTNIAIGPHVSHSKEARAQALIVAMQQIANMGAA